MANGSFSASTCRRLVAGSVAERRPGGVRLLQRRPSHVGIELSGDGDRAPAGDRSPLLRGTSLFLLVDRRRRGEIRIPSEPRRGVHRPVTRACRPRELRPPRFSPSKVVVACRTAWPAGIRAGGHTTGFFQGRSVCVVNRERSGAHFCRSLSWVQADARSPRRARQRPAVPILRTSASLSMRQTASASSNWFRWRWRATPIYWPRGSRRSKRGPVEASRLPAEPGPGNRVHNGWRHRKFK